MSTNNEIQQLQAAVRLLQSQTKQQIRELKDSLPEGNPILGVVDVEQRTDKILALFPCLTKHQARAFLHTYETTTAGVRRRDLIDQLVPWVDERWAELREEVASLHLICGTYGRNTLKEVVKEVNRARRARGAVELATIDSLLQALKYTREKEGGTLTDEEFVEIAPEILQAFDVEEGGSSIVVGGFGLEQLGWLREIKQVIRRDRPKLADPFRGSSEDYYALAALMYEAAANKRMGPLTAERQYEMREVARRYPNTQFQDFRGVKTWGGRWANKKVASEVFTAVPVQGPKQATETRRLTAYGEALLRQFKEVEVVSRFGFAHSVDLLETQALAIEQRRQELLTGEDHTEHGPTWRVDVDLKDLGFEMVSSQTERDAPDKPHESLFKGQSVAQLIESMADALKQLGLDSGGSNASRMLP